MRDDTPKCPEIPHGLVKYLKHAFTSTPVDPAAEDPSQAYGAWRVILHLQHQENLQSEGQDVST